MKFTCQCRPFTYLYKALNGQHVREVVDKIVESSAIIARDMRRLVCDRSNERLKLSVLEANESVFFKCSLSAY